jgi:hypothetical protein
MNIFIDAGGSAGPPPMLLLRGDGSNLSAPVDSSIYARSITGPAVVSTTQSQYGGSSIKLDGTYTHLDFGDSDDFWFGSGDFTIQAWVYVDSASAGGFLGVVGQMDSANAATSQFSFFVTNAGVIGFYGYSGAGQPVTCQSSSGQVATNTWVHVAAVRHGNNFYVYAGGVMKASDNDATTLNNVTAPLRVGKMTFWGQLTGYVDDVEVTKGYCKYPGGTTFTPPAAL